MCFVPFSWGVLPACDGKKKKKAGKYIFFGKVNYISTIVQLPSVSS
jgi:hypothetical protein